MITSHNSPANSKKSKRSYKPFDSLMRYARVLGYGDIHTKFDYETGLMAIIAIHNLNRGPAIGGCRMITYDTMDSAMEDVLRLGYMMSYKAAINELPHGGAKSVILKPKHIDNKDRFFEKFGEFVNECGGRYITAVDSGTSATEMDIIARKTNFVTCTSSRGGENNPSPLTALGVRRAIEAAVKFKLHRDTLDGLHITIQGAGHVGYFLAKELHTLGAKLTMCDVNQKAIDRCVDEFKVNVVSPNAIYDVKADIFAPCALGAILNVDTIQRLKVSIVAGSANSQLAHHNHGTLMHERGILYAPDFLINAGGLIHVAVAYAHTDMQKSLDQIEQIYHRVYEIFERSKKENKSTNIIAETIARERLHDK